MDTDTIPHLPEGMHQLSPHLVCDGAADAITFYGAAFGAEELVRLPGPDGRIMHACVSINGSSVMLVDENLEYGLTGPKTLGGSPVTIHLVVADADASYARAVEAGAVGRMPVAEMFWGDRYGVVEDPYGHLWSLATPQGAPMSTDELAEAAAGAPAM
jgi:PhnB protein